MMTQHGLKKYLRIFGEKGTEAVQKETQQIHDHKVLVPVDASKMSREETAEALRYPMFLQQQQ